MKSVNAYNFSEKGCVFYHAIATSAEHAVYLAIQEGFDVVGMEIELERENVRDEMGNPYECKIEDAIVR